MKLIYHHNEWPWGKTIRILTEDGSGIVEMSFETNNPGVCFISGLSVIEPMRRKGIARCLMLACESYCQQQGIFRIDLSSVLTDWIQEFYKGLGYIAINESDGCIQMYKLLKKNNSPCIDDVTIDKNRQY